MTLSTQIIDLLNSDAAFYNGLSNRDAAEDENTVRFTYPAPVLSGACVGTLIINDNGSIFDDTSDTTHADFDAFRADLESMMEA